jgi:N-acetylglucosamine kinase-like BadF-type ATPase
LREPLFLGVDGGQSSTVALIANSQGKVLGRGVGGPCNHASADEGRRKFLSAVSDCLEQASIQAGFSAREITFEAVCFGLSGGAEDKSAYVRELIRSKQY